MPTSRRKIPKNMGKQRKSTISFLSYESSFPNNAVAVYCIIYHVPGTNEISGKWGPPVPFATSYMVGRQDKTNRTMFPTLKNNEAAGFQGPVKIELLKGAGLLGKCRVLC